MNIYTVGQGETTFVYLNKSVGSYSKRFTLKTDFINQETKAHQLGGSSFLEEFESDTQHVFKHTVFEIETQQYSC